MTTYSDADLKAKVQELLSTGTAGYDIGAMAIQSGIDPNQLASATGLDLQTILDSYSGGASHYGLDWANPTQNTYQQPSVEQLTAGMPVSTLTPSSTQTTMAPGLERYSQVRNPEAELGGGWVWTVDPNGDYYKNEDSTEGYSHLSRYLQTQFQQGKTFSPDEYVQIMDYLSTGEGQDKDVISSWDQWNSLNTEQKQAIASNPTKQTEAFNQIDTYARQLGDQDDSGFAWGLPIGTILSFVPGMQPFGMALSGIDAASRGNPLGVLGSLAGISGLTGAATSALNDTLGVTNPMLQGAISGGISTGISGGNPLLGAALGGLTGNPTVDSAISGVRNDLFGTDGVFNLSDFDVDTGIPNILNASYDGSGDNKMSWVDDLLSWQQDSDIFDLTNGNMENPDTGNWDVGLGSGVGLGLDQLAIDNSELADLLNFDVEPTVNNPLVIPGLGSIMTAAGGTGAGVLGTIRSALQNVLGGGEDGKANSDLLMRILLAYMLSQQGKGANSLNEEAIQNVVNRGEQGVPRTTGTVFGVPKTNPVQVSPITNGQFRTI